MWLPWEQRKQRVATVERTTIAVWWDERGAISATMHPGSGYGFRLCWSNHLDWDALEAHLLSRGVELTTGESKRSMTYEMPAQTVEIEVYDARMIRTSEEKAA